MRLADTNVLLYAISRDPAEQDKAKRANDILAERDLALSEQVLQEFYVQATRPSRPDAIGHRQAVVLIESFRRFSVQDITSAIMMAALDTRQRFQLSIRGRPARKNHGNAISPWSGPNARNLRKSVWLPFRGSLLVRVVHGGRDGAGERLP